MTNPAMHDLLTFAQSKSACPEALRWLSAQESPEQAWQSCERPDWMIWYARRRGVAHTTLVRIACDCARTALRFVPEGEDRPRLAIETTERWLIGEATIEDVRQARNDAAAYAAYAADAADAADAAYAADAAEAAADAAAAADAYAAAYAADAAAAADAYAADAAYAAAARRLANIQMCDIVRSHISYAAVALA